MAILSGLFGDGDSSENGNSSDLLNVLDATGSLDASHSSYEQSVDDDGSSHTSASESHIGTDFDVGSILSNMSDSFNSSDHDGGGIFG